MCSPCMCFAHVLRTARSKETERNGNGEKWNIFYWLERSVQFNSCLCCTFFSQLSNATCVQRIYMCPMHQLILAKAFALHNLTHNTISIKSFFIRKQSIWRTQKIPTVGCQRKYPVELSIRWLKVIIMNKLNRRSDDDSCRTKSANPHKLARSDSSPVTTILMQSRSHVIFGRRLLLILSRSSIWKPLLIRFRSRNKNNEIQFADKYLFIVRMNDWIEYFFHGPIASRTPSNNGDHFDFMRRFQFRKHTRVPNWMNS